MADKEAARKTGEAIIVCQAPDICLTPMGNKMVPVPYPVTANLSDALGTSPNVNFGGKPALTLDGHIPHTKGDEAGTGGGIKSGTGGGKCEPIQGSSTIRAGGQPVIRHDDPFNMNDGNTIGKLVYLPASAGVANSDEDEGFFHQVADIFGTALERAQTLDKQYAIVTRAKGLLQGVFGVGEIVGGAAGILAPEPATSAGGVALVIMGADNAGTGFAQLVTGEEEQTVAEQAVAMAAEAAGLDPEQVQVTAGVAGMMTGGPGKMATKADDLIEDAADLAKSRRRVDAGPGDGTKIEGTKTTGQGPDVTKNVGKARNKPPAPLTEAEGRPHSIIERPGKDGQYTTHYGDGTWKQYRGSGQGHRGIPRPNVKEAGKNVTPDGRVFIDRGHVRPPRPDEIPGD